MWHRINRRSVWLALLAIALVIWGLTDVRNRAKTDPKNLSAHRTDFTVYTAAGAAFFDGRDPYAVANPRGWHYLYPPLFAILVAPLSPLDSQWQAMIWYAISLLAVWGCYIESERLWKWLRSTDNCQGAPTILPSAAALKKQHSPLLPSYVLWLAGATVLLPILNCLQRGQVGVLLAYLLLLGLRCVLTSRTLVGALIGGLVLALPVAVKLTPVLPAGFLCLQLLAASYLDRWSRSSSVRGLATASGLAIGLILYLLVLPSIAVGPRNNLAYLKTWVTRVVANKKVGMDDHFDIHSVRNQSLSNAVYSAGNWLTTRQATSGNERPDDNLAPLTEAKTPMDRAWVQIALLMVRFGLLTLLVAAGWSAARRGSHLGLATVFSLACLLTLLISPLSWVHHYVLWLPAVWLVPFYSWQNGRPRLAIVMALSACALMWTHYLLLPWAGTLGVLGLGTTIWYVVATGSVLRSSDAAGEAMPIERLLLDSARAA
jgi:hypothetical protein